MRRQLTVHSRQSTVETRESKVESRKLEARHHPPRTAPREAAAFLLAFAFCVTGGAGAATVRVTAEEAAARAVRVSHVAAAADARVAGVRETVNSADAAALPSVALSAAAARRSSVPEFAAAINGPLQPPVVIAPDITTTYATSLRLQQPLYAGGAIAGLREATRHDALASGAGRGATVADVRLAAQLAYWESVRLAASVEVARAQEERAARLLDDTRALFDAGMAVKADVLAASERIASARLQLVVARAQADDAGARLASILQLDPGDTVEPADSLSGPLPAAPADARALLERALADRPELAASAEQIAALRARREVAGAQARPSVGAAAQLDYGLPNARYFPLQDKWKDSWSVGVQAGWTVFDGGKARADVATVAFNERAAAHDRAELERRITLEVANGRRDLEAALAAVDAADAARAAAAERETAARDRHAAGLAAMSEILDAQAQLAAADQQLVNARAGSWTAAATLARAVGR